MEVKRTERGWAGHFIAAHDCRFRRNTLLELGETRIVVSSVGQYIPKHQMQFDTIGVERYFETMAFHAVLIDDRWWDADTARYVDFDSEWCIDVADADDKANDMHESVVSEITERIENGETF